MCFLDGTCLPFAGCNHPLINSLASKLGCRSRLGVVPSSWVTALPGWHLTYVPIHATSSTVTQSSDPRLTLRGPSQQQAQPCQEFICSQQ